MFYFSVVQQESGSALKKLENRLEEVSKVIDMTCVLCLFTLSYTSLNWINHAELWYQILYILCIKDNVQL